GAKRLANLSCPATLELLREHRPEAFGGADWILLSGDGETPELTRHLEAGGEGWSVRLRDVSEVLVHHRGDTSEDVIEVASIPATVGGSARHNVANALAAAALSHALGASFAEITAALSCFGIDPDDNPGRLERYELGGVRVLLDFAHNPHGVHALAPSVRQLRESGRLFVTLGQAGDRSQEDLDQLAVEVAALGPDRVFLRPMPGYERGRTYDEMRVMFFAAFERAGWGDFSDG
ncbi:MAG TPA: cyanophycin synthetase, partial [Myxococcota bacterium]|nr:cyanophycin synthetase [Myxococcota bacterium]